MKNGARDLKEFALRIFHVQPVALRIIGAKLLCLDGYLLGELRGTRFFYLQIFEELPCAG